MNNPLCSGTMLTHFRQNSFWSIRGGIQIILFLISPWKHMLWVLIRNASVRHFKWVLTTWFHGEIRKISVLLGWLIQDYFIIFFFHFYWPQIWNNPNRQLWISFLYICNLPIKINVRKICSENRIFRLVDYKNLSDPQTQEAKVTDDPLYLIISGNTSE